MATRPWRMPSPLPGWPVTGAVPTERSRPVALPRTSSPALWRRSRGTTVTAEARLVWSKGVMTPKPRSAEYFDGWYADKAAAPQVAEIMNRNLGLPPDALAGIVPAMAIDEIAEGLRLKPGDVLLDLACGRAWYGLEIAATTGARLIG